MSLSGLRSNRFWRGSILVAWLLAASLRPATLRAADGAGGNDQQVVALLSRWLEALGGARNIAQLKTVDYRCQINFGPALPAVETEVRAQLRGGYRYDYEMPGFGRLTQAFDGRYTWQRNSVLGFGQLTATEHAANLSSVDFQAPLRTAAQFTERRLLPDETIDGRRLHVLNLVDRAGGRSKWYFDPATGLRVRMELDVPAGHIVIENADFRVVPGAGVKEAYLITRTSPEGRTVITMRDIVYNDELDAELFAAPKAAMEDNQAIERILHYHRQFSGADALQQIQSRVTKSLLEITTSGLKIPVTVSQKRPNLLVSQQEVPGMGPVWQGYNGKVGWVWSELEGYRTMQGPELQQMLGNADLEGPMRLSGLCPLRKLLEEKEEPGRRVIGIAMANLAGPAGNFYFDTVTFNLVRVETFIQAGANGQLKVVADFSDFRKTNGVTIPFRTLVSNPAMKMLTTIESVQYNTPLDDAIFEPKKKE